MFRLDYLGLFSILASPPALAAASPGIFEVDLVFPQNDTYAPVPLMPVVFALRNIALASPLDLSISWTFNERGSIDSGSWDGRQNFTHLNASSSDPYLYNSFIPSLAGVESQWVLTWILETGNCSGPGLELTSFASQYNHIVFTTRNTSQPPDLGAAASSATCGKNASSAFNVTAIEEVSLAENFDGQPSCAVLGASPTIQGPCGVTINPSAASSISSAITASACSSQITPGISCPATPSPTSAKSGAGRVSQRHAAWLVIILAIFTSVVSFRAS